MIIACIPAYNEESSIAKVVLRAKSYVDLVMVCDDGSSDDTGMIAEALGAKVIRHERNMGKGEALKSLFKEALNLKPKVVVTIDADGQHSPDEIPRLIEPVLKGEADIVVGSRYLPSGKYLDIPLYRRLGLYFINKLSIKVGGVKVRDAQSGFRAFSLKALEALQPLLESKGYEVEVEQLIKARELGLRVMEVPITVKYKGVLRPSKKNPLSHGGRLVSFLLSKTVERHPLWYLGAPGLIIITIGLYLVNQLFHLFNQTRYFSLPIAIIALGAILTGLLMILTSIMIHELSKLKEAKPIT